jgi:hypothetical protein
MPTIIKFASLNPIKLVRANGGTYWKDSNPFFESDTVYVNKWQQRDILRLQIYLNPTYINIAETFITLNTCTTGVLIDTFTPEVAWIDGNFVCVTFSLTLPAITGDYFVKMSIKSVAGTYEYYYSEPINIKATQPGTVLLIYRCEGIQHDVFFIDHSGGEIWFYFRILGGFRSKDFAPASVSNVYADQSNSFTLLSGIPYVTKKLTIGDNNGIPNYVADLVNRIFCCEETYIDNVLFSKTENSTLEQSEFSERFPKGIWKIELAETPNTEVTEYPFIRPFKDIDTLVESDTFVIEPLTGDDPIIGITVPTGHIPLFAVIVSPTYDTYVTGLKILSPTSVSVNIAGLPNGTYVYYIIY